MDDIEEEEDDVGENPFGGSRAQGEEILQILNIFLVECGDKMPPPSFGMHVWFASFRAISWAEFSTRMAHFSYNYIAHFRHLLSKELGDLDSNWFVESDDDYFEAYIPKEPYSCYEYVYNHFIGQMVGTFIISHDMLNVNAYDPDTFFEDLDTFLCESQEE